MNAETSPERPPLTDNPWFWAYLFATAGLIGVMLLGNKIDRRQEQLDANFTRRQEVLAQRTREGGTVEQAPSKLEDTLAPEEETRYVTFPPLYIGLALAAAVGWGVLWWQHFRPRAREISS